MPSLKFLEFPLIIRNAAIKMTAALTKRLSVELLPRYKFWARLRSRDSAVLGHPIAPLAEQFFTARGDDGFMPDIASPKVS
jgi:hypothetical protein